MKDTDGHIMSEKELIKCAMDHLSEACCFLFETESKEGHSLAFMTDSVLKLALFIREDMFARDSLFEDLQEMKRNERVYYVPLDFKFNQDYIENFSYLNSIIDICQRDNKEEILKVAITHLGEAKRLEKIMLEDIKYLEKKIEDKIFKMNELLKSLHDLPHLFIAV